MPERALPLDAERYRGFLAELRGLLDADPDVTDAEALRAFVRDDRRWFGPRTADATAAVPEHTLRTLLHVMVLAASELADFHASSRVWLSERYGVPVAAVEYRRGLPDSL